MVQRRLLTTDFVKSISPPLQGERWIADTKLRGFGLRLWKTAGGEGKAFAIRAIDSTGRQIRRTWPLRLRRSTLGDVVDNAREWAIDELCRISGKPTLREEESEHRRRIDERISKLTLDDLVKARLRGMEIRGLTEQYRDTLDKLYHKHLPLKIRQTKISKIKPRALAKIYGSLGETPGAAVKLRAFLSQVIKDVEFHSRPLLRAFYLARQSSGTQFHIPRRTFSSFEQSSRLPEELFDKIFESLDRNKPSWLQARFIRLLFEFDVPADRLMKAKWEHFAERYWFLDLQSNREEWPPNAKLIDETIDTLLQDLRWRTEQDFPNSAFLFPSRLSSTGHIRSFQTTWVKAASECELECRNLKMLIRSYHWSVVFPRRRLAYHARNYGKLVQGTEPRHE